MNNQKTNSGEKLAAFSFLLGVLCTFGLAPLTSIPAIICGRSARRRLVCSGTCRGRIYAGAGITLGVFYFLLTLALIAAFWWESSQGRNPWR